MVLAIARRESRFDPRAQPGVGARGLMPMMPATAQRTARRVGAAGSPVPLFTPARRVRLSSAARQDLRRAPEHV